MTKELTSYATTAHVMRLGDQIKQILDMCPLRSSLKQMVLTTALVELATKERVHMNSRGDDGQMDHGNESIPDQQQCCP